MFPNGTPCSDSRSRRTLHGSCRLLTPKRLENVPTPHLVMGNTMDDRRQQQCKAFAWSCDRFVMLYREVFETVKDPSGLQHIVALAHCYRGRSLVSRCGVAQGRASRWLQ